MTESLSSIRDDFTSPDSSLDLVLKLSPRDRKTRNAILQSKDEFLKLLTQIEALPKHKAILIKLINLHAEEYEFPRRIENVYVKSVGGAVIPANVDLSFYSFYKTSIEQMPYGSYLFRMPEFGLKVVCCLSLFDALCMFYGYSNPDQRNVIEIKES